MTPVIPTHNPHPIHKEISLVLSSNYIQILTTSLHLHRFHSGMIHHQLSPRQFQCLLLKHQSDGQDLPVALISLSSKSTSLKWPVRLNAILPPITFPISSLTPLLSPCLLCSSRNGLLVPQTSQGLQGLRVSCFLCLCYSSLRYPLGSFFRLPQVFVLISPSQ